MANILCILKCVVLLNVLLNRVHSFELVKFNNLNEEQLLAKISQILDQSDDQSVENVNHIALRGNRRDFRDADNTFQRRRLIKTIVPHGQKVKFRTLGESMYKTLVRIHKKQKPIFVKDKDGYKIEFDSVARSKGRPVEVKKKKYNAKYNRITAEDFSQFWEKLKSLKYKHLKQKPKNNNLNSNKKLLRSFLNNFKLNTTKFKKSLNFFTFNKTRVKNNISELWKKVKKAFPLTFKKKHAQQEKTMNKLTRILDYSGETLRTRSGEEHDPLAPGRVPFNLKFYETTTKKSNNWLPIYSFWNYWTYDKTLHQDDCEGNLIKVGDKCIGSPPH